MEQTKEVLDYSDLAQVRAYFENDRFATNAGMKIDTMTEYGCICSMDLNENHLNAIGAVMGGVMFTLADFAFAVASNRDHLPTVALDATIQYLSSPKGKRLIATAERIKSGRTTGVFQVKITDENGKAVALYTVTGYKS